MGIIPAGRGQDVVVVRGISHLSADVDLAPIDRGNGGSVNQAVNERGVGVVENLLDGTGKLVGRLSPIVVFHCNDKYALDSPAVATAAIPVGVYR